MKDLLEITNLTIQTHIGVHAWEQRILQPLLVSIRIPTDFSQCNDELKKTIDYAELCQQVTSLVESNFFMLIETVAEKVAQLIKEKFLVNTLTVSVSKPHAIKNTGNICVTINR